MNIHVDDLPADTYSVVITPTDDDGQAWHMLAGIADYCWAHFGVDLDHDAVVITFVYAPTAEDGRQAAPQAVES